MPSPGNPPGSGGLPPRPVNVPTTRALQVGVQAGTSLPVVRARQVIIIGTAGELLVYSPAAAAGNLIASVAAADFTDPYGNAGLAGVASYADNGTFVSASVMFGGTINWYQAGTAAGPWNIEAGIGFGFVSGQGGFLTLQGLELQSTLGAASGVIPQAGGSSITTVAGVVAVLEAMGLLAP